MVLVGRGTFWNYQPETRLQANEGCISHSILTEQDAWPQRQSGRQGLDAHGRSTDELAGGVHRALSRPSERRA